jgi:hypothetical protein
MEIGHDSLMESRENGDFYINVNEFPFLGDFNDSFRWLG